MPASDTSLDQVVARRLAVEIDGLPTVDLARDIIAIRFTETITQCKLLEVSLNNWGTVNGDIGYKYSGGAQDLLNIGTGVRLYCDDLTLAVGKIAILAMSFGKGPPAITFSVDANRPRQQPREVVFTISRGAGLMEFYPVLRKTASSGQPRIQATGIANGSPFLRAGTKLNIAGLGRAFDGKYSVTESTHTFDNTGYRTSFACER